MKKRILFFALMLALCPGLFLSAASAADSDFIIQDIDIEGRHYTNVLTAYNGPGGDVVIPNGVKYVGLGIGWDESYGAIFAGRKDITSVSIPEGALAVGGSAFAGCTGLTSVTIPNSMLYITSFSFAGCTSLTSVTIPGSVQRITTGAFSGCTGLTSLTLCEGVRDIEGEAFMGCTGLTSVSIPSSANIESRAFQDCANLIDITIPPTVNISGNPFDGTAWRERRGDWLIINNTLLEYVGRDPNVVIPNNVKALGSYWYRGDWDTVKSITIPNSVTTIGLSAFNGGFSSPPWGFITTVDIPDSVTEIGAGAFSYSYLASLELPNSVTTIGNGAFSNCQYLTSIVIPDSVTSIGGWVFDNSQKVTIHGSHGSYAETYAKENNIPFIADLSPKVGGFNDVRESDYFAQPVLWAIEKGITGGTTPTTFSPGAACTRSHILTFLWRSRGKPEPSIQNPFSDVSADDYYYKAALWASEKGLVSGSTFGGDTSCTRAATITYLWRLAGSPAASPAAFTDVPTAADYAQAVAWAVSEGITGGTSTNMFSPSNVCTRAQVLTFLYRFSA